MRVRLSLGGSGLDGLDLLRVVEAVGLVDGVEPPGAGEGLNSAALNDDPGVLEDVVGDDLVGREDLDAGDVAGDAPEVGDALGVAHGRVDEKNVQALLGSEARRGCGQLVFRPLELTGIIRKSLDSLVGAGPLSFGDVLDDTEETVVQLGAERGAQTKRPDLAGQVLSPVTGLQLEDRRSSTTSTAARVSDTGLSGSLLRPQFPAGVRDSRTVLRALVTLTEGREVPDDVAVEDVAAEGKVEDVSGEGKSLAIALRGVLGGKGRDGVVDRRVEVRGDLVEADCC